MKKNIMSNQGFYKILKWCIVVAIMPSFFMVTFAENTKAPEYSEATLTNQSRDIKFAKKLEGKNQISSKKSLLTKEKRKISTDLLRLVDHDFVPKGKTQLDLKNEMKVNKQYMTSTSIATKTGEAFEGVYVYISLNNNVDIYAVDSYLQRVTDRDEKSGVIAAWVGLDQLSNLAADEKVKAVKTVIAPKINAGSKITEGNALLKADKVLSNFKQNGAGIKIGVLSDGVDYLSSSVATGDLPSDVVVLGNTTDAGNQSEGVAMLEIIYDMAPGAKLYFHDMGANTIAFNSAIDELVAAGCNVIVDDVGWLAEPFFEDGDVASHVAAVLNSKNIVYVSSAGNNAGEHYQGTYSAYSTTDSFHKDDLFVKIPPNGSVLVIAQWNDKFGSSNNDYDLYLFNAVTWSTLDSSTYEQSGTDDPIEYIEYKNTTSSTINAAISIDNYQAETKTLEIFIYTDGISSVYTNNLTSGDSIFGHPAVPGVLTVGAVDQTASSVIRPYSSLGPVSISYPSTVSRPKPDICGVDGVSVTGAGGFSTNFYGTSAAAPHIAAIAALLWAENPQKTGNQIRDLLKTNAKDIGSLGIDNIYGYGLSDAMKVFMATMADNIFTTSVTTGGGKNVAIASSGSWTNEVWLAPSGTTTFVQGTNMTKALGDATSIVTPTASGTYKLYLVVEGTVSTASTATVTVDSIAPTNQNTVFSTSVSKKGNVSISIVSSGDSTNSVWLAPFGTTNFVAGSTMTKATNGIATTITTPSTDGVYNLFVIDAVGNISLPSTAILTVDNTTFPLFTVSYNTNGGTAVATLYDVNALANPLPTTSTKVNYIFDGWYTDADLTIVAVAGSLISQNTELYAKWKVIDFIVSDDGVTTVYNLDLVDETIVANIVTTYTVSYNTNGGKPISDLTGVIALPNPLPTPMHLPYVTTGGHYIFNGWYTDPDLTVAVVADTTIFANTILYAKWTYYPGFELPSEYAFVTIKNDQEQIVDVIIPANQVATIATKIPVTFTQEDINDVEFGIIFGGIKFKSLSTSDGLNLNQGKFIIKFVDLNGVYTGKTFKAIPYFGNELSTQVIDVTFATIN